MTTVTHNIPANTRTVTLNLPTEGASGPFSKQLTKALKDNSGKIAFIGSLLLVASQEPTAGPLLSGYASTMMSTASSVFEFAKNYIAEINLALSAFWGTKCTYNYVKQGEYTKALGVVGAAAISAKFAYILKDPSVSSSEINYTKAFTVAVESLKPAAKAAMDFFYPTV